MTTDDYRHQIASECVRLAYLILDDDDSDEHHDMILDCIVNLRTTLVEFDEDCFCGV